MNVIIKREFRNYLKNPIYWIGIIVVLFGVYQAVSPYLQLHYFQSEEEIRGQTVENLSDAVIMEGYLPAAQEKKMQLGYAEIKKNFIEAFEKSEAEAEQIVKTMQKKEMTIPEIAEYLKKNYGFYSADYIFEDLEYYQGSLEAVNAYISEQLGQKPFSFYFARKFADFAGLFMGFFAAVLLAFLFLGDTRKDTYELLHTKPVSAESYILGKVGGGFTALLLVIIVLNAVFGGLCAFYAGKAGFPIRFWDMIAATVIYILPNMLMIICVYAAIALLFKNPLPATPFLFLYIIYSNMGSIGPDGHLGYYGRPLAIMVRFPGRFFETAPPPLSLLNQVFLIAASSVLIVLAVLVWKRRRVY